MFRLILLCCFCLLSSFLAHSTSPASPDQYIKNFIYQVGDDKRWTDLDWPDKDWLHIYDGLPKQATVFWTRSHVMVNKVDDNLTMGIFSTIFGSYELYWDGQLLAKSGIVGHDKASEKAGPIITITRIPQHLYTPGEHMLSARVSSFHSPDKLRERYHGLYIHPYDELLFAEYNKNLPPMVILGALIIIALYYLQLYWLYSRDKPLLLFSLLCFAVSALLITESYKGLFGYSYDWHLLRLNLVGVFTATVSLLLPLFFLHQFDIKHKKPLMLILMALLCAIVLSVVGYDTASELMLLCSFVFTLLLALYAWRQRHHGAILATVGLSIVILTKLLSPHRFEDSLFFPSFGVLILFMLTLLTRRMVITQRERDSALVNSAHLEIMLLKKNIQPHFILNTLTSIEQWIEEEPQTAVKFIDALADEFKLMNAMADQKQVPLSQELSLCRSHLQIMSYRKDMNFTLLSEQTDNDLLVPPAIIHTLIENALTHNIYLQGTVTLTLTQQRHQQSIELSLIAPLNLAKTPRQPGNGTGLKYIKSRLQESYPDQWQLEQQQTAEHWITHIRFKESSR